MSNIDKQAVREAAEKALLAGDGKWNVWREAGQKYPEIFTSSGHIVATVNGAFPVARSDFIAAANPATVLALLDELEAKDALNKHLELAIRKAEGCSEALRRKTEAAEKRIAELQARDITIKQHAQALFEAIANPSDHYVPAYARCLREALNGTSTGKGE
ncbi:ead/Ea22-like family protein [Enterobacter hormaechei]|nr:ead/Ea22-like family protein [Enterobacter hormaechei]